MYTLLHIFSTTVERAIIVGSRSNCSQAQYNKDTRAVKGRGVWWMYIHTSLVGDRYVGTHAGVVLAEADIPGISTHRSAPEGKYMMR